MGEPDLHHKQLADRHLRELREGSAIVADVMDERGYRTITDRAELLALGFADYQARVPALLVPLYGVDGSNGRYALKPDHPRVGADGKVRKYEYPSGSKHMLDVPPRCLEALHDPGVRLVFTEGGKKADCLASRGYCAVNIWGTSAWYRNPQHGGFATIEPLADWDAIKPTLDGRICYLAYDSDAWRNPNVARELRRLANWLSRQGALVYIIHLPDGNDGSKNGVDDYVARHGDEAFDELLADAEPWGSHAMVQKLEAELRELRAIQSAQASVLRNQDLTPAQKTVALVTINDAGWQASVDHPLPYRVRPTRLADAAGVAPHTVSQSLKLLSAEGGLFTKQVKREWVDQETGWVSAMFLTPRVGSDMLTLLQAAAVYAPEHPPPAVRRQVHCPVHPVADLQRRSTTVCTECGQVLSERVVVLKVQKRISETDHSSSLLRTTEDVLAISAPCRRCGRPWDVHGAVDIFGICAERAPPGA